MQVWYFTFKIQNANENGNITQGSTCPPNLMYVYMCNGLFICQIYTINISTSRCWFSYSLVVVSCSVMVYSCSILISLCFGNRHFILILLITVFYSVLIILLIISHYTDSLILTGCISFEVINGNQNLTEITTSKKVWWQTFKNSLSF